MAIIEIRMPDDEKEGTEASLGTWFKAVGEMVSEHEPLVEINTDKVTIEIASPATGRIGLLIKQSGDSDTCRRFAGERLRPVTPHLRLQPRSRMRRDRHCPNYRLRGTDHPPLGSRPTLQVSEKCWQSLVLTQR